MKLDELMHALQETFGTGLQSVVLYGSAVNGDHVGKLSNYNVLAVVDNFSLPKLRDLSKQVRKWVKAGNPPPLLFTETRLRAATDIFPIELKDIKDCHRLLYGRDCLHDLNIGPCDLRLQLERELHGKLIQLREEYLVCAQKDREVKSILLDSISSILVLCRAALRLWSEDVPVKKLEAAQRLTGNVRFDYEVFVEIFALKQGGSLKNDPHHVFERYLEAINQIVTAVDEKLVAEQQEN